MASTEQPSDNSKKSSPSDKPNGSSESSGNSRSAQEKQQQRKKWSKEKFKERLTALQKQDGRSISLILARHALRRLPFLAKAGDFERLKEVAVRKAAKDKSQTKAKTKAPTTAGNNERTDQVSAELLTLFTVSNLLLSKFSTAEFCKQDNASAFTKNQKFFLAVQRTAFAYAAAAYAAAAYDAAAYAYDAAAYAAAAYDAAAAAAAYADAADADADAATAATATAAAAATATAAAAAYATVDAYDAALEKDVIYLEENGDVTEQINALLIQPLWLSEIPKAFDELYRNKFIPAVNNLIKESKDKESKESETQQALEHLLARYEFVLNGANSESTEQIQVKTLPDFNLSNEQDSTLDDQLDRKGLVSGLAGLLSDKNNTQHLTVGLLGHWGLGKTYVLDLLRAELKNSKKEPSKKIQGEKSEATKEAQTTSEPEKQAHFIFGEFNAWAYEQSKNMQAAMAHEVIKSLSTFQGHKTIASETPLLKKFAYSIYNLGGKIFFNLTSRLRLMLGFVIRKSPIKFIVLATILSGFGYLGFWLSHHLEILTKLSNKTILDFQVLGSLGTAIVLLAFLFKTAKELRTLFAQPLTKELLTYISLPNYAPNIGEVAQMRDDIKLMCDIRLRSGASKNEGWLGNIRAPKRLLFVVDDLDRCGPEGIVKTFEAIRLVLDIPHVTVVVTVDQRIALAALAKHYKDLAEHHQLNDAKAIARDYLAKIIHLPIVLADPDKNSVMGYMSSIWQEDKTQKKAWQVMIDPELYGELDDGEAAAETAGNNMASNKEGNKENNDDQQVATEENKLADMDDLAKDDDVEALSDEEIIAELMKLPIAGETVIKEVEELGLSDHQKAAFIYWLDVLSLNNPRQLKRLHNSYNLLRLVTGREDFAVADLDPDPAVEEEENSSSFGYGLLVTLLVLEFINNHDDSKLRKKLLTALKKDDDKFSFCSGAKKQALIEISNIITRYIVVLKEQDERQSRAAFINLVSLYVLPAIGSLEEQKDEKQS